MTSTTTAVELTARQTQILRAIVEHWGEHAVPPTLRELCATVGISSPNGIVSHLRAMAAKGAIVWRTDASAKARSIVIPALAEAARVAADELLKRLPKGRA